MRISKKLCVLRDEILIIGSGNIVHNLGLIDWHTNQAFDWAVKFNEEIKKLLLENNHQKIIEFKKLNNSALAVPTSEHFIPLLYVLGSQDENAQEKNSQAEIFCEGIELGSISMMGVKFGNN